MFSPELRTLVRATLFASGAAVSSLIASSVGSDLTLNEGLLALGSFIGGLTTWYGIGSVSKNVEPHLGPNVGDGS